MKIPSLVMGQSEPLHTPIVYIQDAAKWEYKQIEREMDTPMDEAELNTMGAEGWELVGVIALQSKAYFYFKRLS